MKRYITLLFSLLCFICNVKADTYRIHLDSLINKYINELYTSWDNSRLHCYNNIILPEQYEIILSNSYMPTDNRVVTSHFGYRPSFKRNHYGVDVKAYIGDTIRSAFSGRVRVANYQANGYGYYIVIRHPNGLETVYGHLSKQLVKINAEVYAGMPIGLAGNTGCSTGSHLHFETRILGKPINPELMFDFTHQKIVEKYTFFDKKIEI